MNQLENTSSNESVESTQSPAFAPTQTATDNLESLQRAIAEIKDVLVGRQQTFPEELSWAGGESIALVDDLDARIVDMLEALDRGEEIPVSTYEDLERETTRVVSVVEMHFHTELYEAIDLMVGEVTETLRLKSYNFEHLEHGAGDAEDLLQETQLLVNDLTRLRGSYWNREAKYAAFNTVANKVVQFDENISGLDDAMGLTRSAFYDERMDTNYEEAPLEHTPILSPEEHDYLIETLSLLDPEDADYSGRVIDSILALAEGRSWADEAHDMLEQYIANGRPTLNININEESGRVSMADHDSFDPESRMFELERGQTPTWGVGENYDYGA